MSTKSCIKEIQNSSIEILNGHYKVKVKLKDESIYTYAPRRFAFTERIKLRKMTDDLLARDIIKPLHIALVLFS